MKQIYCLYLAKKTPQEELLKLAEACYRFTPLVAIREGEAIFLDMTASLHLFKQTTLAQRLLITARRFGHSVRISNADEPGTALALARMGFRDPSQLPLTALADYASPFQPLRSADGILGKKIEKLVEVLTDLGVLKVSDFLKIPASALASRFGKEAVEVSMKIQKHFFDAWPSVQFPEKICEELDLFESDTMAPCSDLEPLLFAIRVPLDRMMARLKARSLRLSSFQLTFQLQRLSEFRAARDRSWSLTLPVPQGSTRALLGILRDRLDLSLQKEPLVAPVVSIRAECLETAPGNGAQTNFFHRKVEEAEAWDGLVARLVDRLGADQVWMAETQDTHRPEASWRRVLPSRLPELEPTSGAGAGTTESVLGSPLRPLRLLPDPKPLQREGQIFRSSESQGREVRWEIQKMEGPEKVSGDWWAAPYSRQYFRITTSVGSLLWVFQTQSGWFLQGYFD